MGELPALGGELLAGADGEDLGGHAARLLEDEADLGGADPLLRVDELLLLVADVDQALLDLGVGGDGRGRVTLVSVGGKIFTISVMKYRGRIKELHTRCH